jgi:carbon-monoxide dehydrogenase medium subunit
VIRHGFDYRAPRELDAALEILARAGEGCAVLGGGTWLVPNMTFANHQPKVVLDPKHLGLASIAEVDGHVLVGARATYIDALKSPLVAAHVPMLAAMAAGITGGVAITGQGTIGGSACYANPSSDVPACLVTLRARLRLQSASGTRDVEASDFFRGRFATTRRPDEMLTAILFPKRTEGARFGYYKLKFSTGTWPIVTAAAVVENGRVRVTIGAATDTPLLSESALPSDGAALRAFAASCAEIRPDIELADELAGPGYRRRVACSIVLRALDQCGVMQ